MVEEFGLQCNFDYAPWRVDTRQCKYLTLFVLTVYKIKAIY